MSSDSSPEIGKIEQNLQEKVVTVDQLRGRYTDLGSDAQVPNKLHKSLAAITVDYYYSLRKHRNEAAFEKDWPDIVHKLESYLNKTATVSAEPAGRSRAESPKEVPAVLTIPIEDIVEATLELDDIAKDLGIAVSVAEATPKTETDMDDLVGIVDIRGQDSAKENLPGDA